MSRNTGSDITTSKSETSRHLNETNFSSHFLVKIFSSCHGAVVARTPKEFSLQLDSEWESAISGPIGGNLAVLAAESVGKSTRTKELSAQVWSGNSPIEFTVPLEFYAETSAAEEVVNPILRLAKMALPRSSGGSASLGGLDIPLGVFIPPGPRVFDLPTSDSANDQITVRLGNFLNFKKVIVTAVNPVFITSELHADGYPLRATCDITFRTLFSLTGESLSGAFI